MRSGSFSYFEFDQNSSVDRTNKSPLASFPTPTIGKPSNPPPKPPRPIRPPGGGGGDVVKK
jgi:hypothetical protein